MVKRFLQRIHNLVNLVHRPQLESDAPLLNARVFNAGFMIAYRQSHVFEEMNELSTTLFDSALVLMEFVERIAKLVLEKGSFGKIPKDATVTFTAVMFKYLRNFKLWKIPDEAKLTGRIWNALMALEQAQMQLPEVEPADSNISVEFRTQIVRLRGKMEQIAGRAKLQEYDNARAAQRANPFQRIRGVGRLSHLSSNRMSNEQLAHELLLDSAFQLNDFAGTEHTALDDLIRQNFHDVSFFLTLSADVYADNTCAQFFYISLVDDLTLQPPCFARVIRLLREVRDGISDVGSVHLEIRGVIDLQVIENQINHRVFSWIDCTNLISSIVHIIKRVQLPARDTSLRIEWEKVRLVMEATPSLNAKALVGGLRFLMDRLAILRVDAANLRCVIIFFGCVGCTLIAFPFQPAPDWPGCKGARHRVRERQVQGQCRGRHHHPRAR